MKANRGYHTFSDSIGSVLRVCTHLTDTVPVDAGAIVLEFVSHSNANGITPVCGDHGARILIVDEHTDTSLSPVRIACGVRNRQIILRDIIQLEKGRHSPTRELTVRVTPVFGVAAKRLVVTSKPGSQQFRVVGP